MTKQILTIEEQIVIEAAIDIDILASEGRGI